VKGARSGVEKTFAVMPFFPNGLTPEADKPKRNMMIGMNEMEIEEVSTINALKTNVLYFTVPEEEFPSLVRRTTFTNLDLTSTLTLDVLDGLAKLEPSGIGNGNLDTIGRTMEAWMNVYNAAEDAIKEPFFHISQSTGDTAQVCTYMYACISTSLMCLYTDVNIYIHIYIYKNIYENVYV
jgi:hypothetical protein